MWIWQKWKKSDVSEVPLPAMQGESLSMVLDVLSGGKQFLCFHLVARVHFRDSGSVHLSNHGERRLFRHCPIYSHHAERLCDSVQYLIQTHSIGASSSLTVLYRNFQIKYPSYSGSYRKPQSFTHITQYGKYLASRIGQLFSGSFFTMLMNLWEFRSQIFESSETKSSIVQKPRLFKTKEIY